MSVFWIVIIILLILGVLFFVTQHMYGGSYSEYSSEEEEVKPPSVKIGFMHMVDPQTPPTMLPKSINASINHPLGPNEYQSVVQNLDKYVRTFGNNFVGAQTFLMNPPQKYVNHPLHFEKIWNSSDPSTIQLTYVVQRK